MLTLFMFLSFTNALKTLINQTTYQQLKVCSLVFPGFGKICGLLIFGLRKHSLKDI